MSKKRLGTLFKELNLKLRGSKPLTELHLFPQLPTELQLLIWESAKEPRHVVVTTISKLVIMSNKKGYQKIKPTLVPKAVCKIPAILHTSRCSRFAAMSTHRLEFARQLDGCPVFFNFEKGTLDLLI